MDCDEEVVLSRAGAPSGVTNRGHNARVLTLRDARPEDAAEVAGVHVRSWQVAYRGLLPDEYLDGLRAEDRAQRYTFDLVGPDHPATTVAVEGDEICGFVTTGPARGEAQGVGAVQAIYVDPTAWGRGVGLSALPSRRLASRRAATGRRRLGHSSEQHPLSTPSSLTLVSFRREGLASR
jgi:GNAT superfamily N-acetyltransferase